MVAALSTIYFINAGFTYYGAAVINAQMAKELNLERSVLGLGVPAVLLVQAFFSPLIAWVINRSGARLTLFYGSVLLAFGAFLLIVAKPPKLPSGTAAAS